MDHNRRVREGRRKLHESMADNRFSGSLDNAKLYESQNDVETAKKTIEERLTRDLNDKMRGNTRMLKAEINLRVTADEAATAKARIDKIHESLRAGTDASTGAVLTDLTQRSEMATRTLALTAIATQTAKRVQQNRLADALLKNTAKIDNQLLRDYAGGIDSDNGSDSALAMAVAVKRDADTKIVNERNQLISQFNLSGSKRQKLAMGTENVVGEYMTADGPVNYTFKTTDKYAREAAIETQLKIGAFQEIQNIIEASGDGGALFDYRKAISEGMATNSLGNKGIYLSGKTIDRVSQGLITGHGAILESAADFVLDGNFKAEDLANNQPDAINTLLEAVRNRSGITPDKSTQFDQMVIELKQKASEILDPATPTGRNATAATMDQIKRIISEL
jgi:hypothetical protein